MAHDPAPLLSSHSPALLTRFLHRPRRVGADRHLLREQPRLLRVDPLLQHQQVRALGHLSEREETVQRFVQLEL